MGMRMWALLFLAATLTLNARQDDEEKKHDENKQDEAQPEKVVCEFAVGKRTGANPMNIPGFKAKPPLALDFKAATDDTLRTAVGKGLQYVLDQQQENGSWTLNPKVQLRKEFDVKKDGLFVMTARDSTNPIVMTSLACLALRSQQEMAPGRIEDAVRRGLHYILENAPDRNKKGRSYEVWTLSFTLQFLADEYGRTFDLETRSAIQACAQLIADRLVKEQHPGISNAVKIKEPDPKKVKRPAVEKDHRDDTSRKSKGGFFGVQPAEDDEVGKEGALIVMVDPKGPAGKGGLKAGDRIIQVDDIKVEDVAHLYEIVDSLDPEATVKVTVLRTPGWKPKPQRTPQGIQMFGKIPSDGGWSYYAIGAISFTTATALLSLMQAKEMGCDVPKDSIDRGTAFLMSMRVPYAVSGELAYAYHEAAKNGPIADIRASVGRVAVCELALLKTGKHEPDQLDAALDVFAVRRGELDRVRGYPGNHFTRSFMNAAYYFLYGHFYTAMATNFAKDAETKKKAAIAVQEALLKIQKDGTWTDHEAWGQLYGTCMALRAFGQIKWLNPGAYKKPIEVLQPRDKNEY